MGLPRILANAEGRKLEEIYRNANEGVLQDVELLQKITQGTRAAVRALVQESTDSQGRVKEVQNVMEKALGGMFGLGVPLCRGAFTSSIRLVSISR